MPRANRHFSLAVFGHSLTDAEDSSSRSKCCQPFQSFNRSARFKTFN